VPNTKLIFPENNGRLFSPHLKQNSKEVSISSNGINQQNPAIYEIFKPLKENYKTNVDIPHLSDISGEEQK